MRLLKMPYIAVIGGVALLLLIGVAAWQAGWLDGAFGTSQPAYAVDPQQRRIVGAVLLAVEIQRLREALGESDATRREAANSARVQPWAKGVSDSALAELKTERAALATRYFALVDDALVHAQWPAGAEAFEGDAAFYEAKARQLLLEARPSFLYADARGVSASAALNDAAQARAIAQGRTTRPLSFSGLDMDARQALTAILPAGLQAPPRGTKTVPATALPIPGLN